MEGSDAISVLRGWYLPSTLKLNSDNFESDSIKPTERNNGRGEGVLVCLNLERASVIYKVSFKVRRGTSFFPPNLTSGS